MKFLYYSFLLLLLLLTLLYLLRILIFETGLIFLTQRWWRSMEDLFHVYQSFKVPEFHDDTHQDNNLYKKVSSYVNSLSSLEDSDNTNLFTTSKKPNDIVLRLDPTHHQLIRDNFLGAKLRWEYSPFKKTFLLKIRKADKRRVLRPYLQHIHALSEQKNNHRDLTLYITVDEKTNQRWRSVPLTHPSTFETIAMENDLKNKIKSDLENFLKGKQYYHRLGRAWKRSYLLYGPSGTGKSTFVAAMANFLAYDIYEMDLTRVVVDDSELKLLLLNTKPKSVILIEDLDRFLTEREKTTSVSFSGFMNFMDGILSCCAEERIMVFTMSSKGTVDPNLLRPGRIDVHIHFPLCDFLAFKTLASSYLGVKDHKLFPQVEEIFQTGASLSPAEIGELMIANRSSPSRALKSVITALQAEGEFRIGNPGLRKSTGEEEEEDHSGILSKEGFNAKGKDFRKLYGLFKLRGSRKSQSLDSSPGCNPTDG